MNVGVSLFKRIAFLILMASVILLTVAGASAEENITADVPSQEPISEADITPHTFSDLQNKINNAEPDSKLYLSGKYKYNKDTDSELKNGVVIKKDLTIIGEDSCTIDGAHLARCLRIKEGCTVVLKNVKIKNGYTKTNGAGVKIGENCKVTFENCVFSGNIAKKSNGGAIESKKSCSIKIHSCTFKNNKATHSDKSSSKTGMGGAIRTSIDTKLRIYDSTFNSNRAYLTTILVVSLTGHTRKTSSLYISNCIFTKNKSDHNGVIYSDEYGKCTLKNSVFTKNKSPKGAGTVVIESSRGSLVKDCKFYKNKGLNGAGINVKVYKKKDSSKVSIVNCKFSKNTAGMYGGAICSVGGNLNIKNSKFYANKASRFGGAVYARLGTLYASSSHFWKNKAHYAGALCLACKKSNVKSSSITHNTAYYLYGGSYIVKHNKLTKCHSKSNVVLKYSKVYAYKSGKHVYVKITDNKDKPIKKKVKLVFKGSKNIKTKWHKTSKNKYKKIRIPKRVRGACTVSVKVKHARYFTKTLNIDV